MPLPTIDLPTFELTIPSTGKVIKARPFVVKEEKLLLMAAASQNIADVINTTKQVIGNCIIEGEVKIDELPYFDIDYLLIALIGKSIGETVDVKFKCKNMVEGKECGNIFPVKIDVTNVKVIKDDAIPFEIPLSGTMKVKMKYPTYAMAKAVVDADTDLDKTILMIIASIQYIQDKEKVYTMKDTTPKELKEFVEGLPQEKFDRLKLFVDNLPNFVVTSEATCDKCGFEHKLEYNDFESFFT